MQAGRVIQPSDDLDRIEAESDRIVADDLMTLRTKS